MKRSIQMVKHTEYIRTAPVQYPNGIKEYLYCCSPMVYDGYKVVDEEVRLVMHFSPNSYMAKKVGTNSFLLPSIYSDKNWKNGDVNLTGIKSELNAYHDEYIVQVQPVNGKIQFDKPVKLVAATKYHVTILNQSDEKMILDCRYTDKSIWKLS